MRLFLFRRTLGVLVGLGMAATASGQTPDRPAPRIIRAVRTSAPPVIDGRLTDETWALAPPADGFTQRDPDEGRPATERTEIRILFDDTAVYVGARMFDAEPARIDRRLSSRDGDPDADRVTIFLDPMHDKLTGAIFRVSAANVQQDAVLYNDSWRDSTWDAVWQSQVSTDEHGWSAETAHSAVAVALRQRRASDVGHQRRALRPAQERVFLARDGAEERERQRLADARADRARRHAPAAQPGAAAVRGRARGACRAVQGRQPLQRRLARLRRRRAST